MEKITGRIDAAKIVREMSRDAFKRMPRPSRVNDKRNKPARYKIKWENERGE
jgi:hypothetical protein